MLNPVYTEPKISQVITVKVGLLIKGQTLFDQFYKYDLTDCLYMMDNRDDFMIDTRLLYEDLISSNVELVQVTDEIEFSTGLKLQDHVNVKDNIFPMIKVKA